MNLHNCFPITDAYTWGVLENLATRDWLTVHYSDDAGSGLEATLDVTGLSSDATRLVELMRSGALSVEGGPLKGLLWMYTMSRLIAEGPKVFRPTAEQCESLEHVAINVPLGDYRQPYPTMLVELPREYRDDVDRRTGGVPACPRFVVVRHWREGMCFTGCQVVDAGGLPAELLYVFGGKAKDGTIEEVLGVYLNMDTRETALMEAVTRVALNLMLLLAHSSSRLVPTDPAGLAKCRDKLKKGIRPDLQRREIAGHVHVVVPDREVLVREVRHAAAAAGGAHASPQTHWRRGHWRAAPGCALARGRGETVPLVFVRPCLVLGAGGEPAAPCYVTAGPPPTGSPAPAGDPVATP